MESGLRISPEQWSALLYGDQKHKSDMQSIIDKVNPLSRSYIAAVTLGDTSKLHVMSSVCGVLVSEVELHARTVLGEEEVFLLERCTHFRGFLSKEVPL